MDGGSQKPGDADVHACRGHAPQRELPPETTKRLRALVEDMVGLETEGTMCETMSILAEVGLTLPQLITLGRIEVHGPHSIGRIASHLGLSVAATSHLVDRMVRQGLVTRVEDVEDRRQKRVSVTDEGQRLARRLMEARVREITRMLAGMPENLADEFEQVMEKVVSYYKTKRSI